LSKKGQLLLLAVIVLASAVLYALSVLKYSHPRAVLVRDYIQAAEVVQLARVWIKYNLNVSIINQTLLSFYQLNKTYHLNIPLLTYTISSDTLLDFYEGYCNYSVVFRTNGKKYVKVVVYYEYYYCGSYFRRIGAEEVLVYNYTLLYYHVYEGPWGRLVLYPQLIDIYHNLDLKYLGKGSWILGVPANMTWMLIDRYEIPIKVGG